jgi:hypothetical protein
MASTNFVQYLTNIPASWLNDVNGIAYAEDLTAKTTLDDADVWAVKDSADSFTGKKVLVSDFMKNAYASFWNVAGTIKSAFTNTNTVARTYTLQNQSGTIAHTSQLGGRNRLINGGMSVDQIHVGAAQTITAAAALAYTVDQWWAACTGANVTGQRVAGSNQTEYRYQFSGAASVTGIQFGQRIEARNVYDLNGQTATLSVELSNSLLSTVTWTAYYANSANAFGSLASPTKTQIATGTFAVTSTPTVYNAQISMPANAANGVEIVFSVGAQTAGTWTIGNAQLELGGAATPFEFKPFSSVLEASRAYYRKSYTYTDAPGTATSNGADTDVWINTTDFYDLGCRSLRGGHMFSLPTMTLYSTATGATGVVRSAPGADIAAAVRFVGDSAFSVYTPAAGGTASQGAYWQWAATAYIP